MVHDFSISPCKLPLKFAVPEKWSVASHVVSRERISNSCYPLTLTLSPNELFRFLIELRFVFLMVIWGEGTRMVSPTRSLGEKPGWVSHSPFVNSSFSSPLAPGQMRKFSKLLH